MTTDELLALETSTNHINVVLDGINELDEIPYDRLPDPKDYVRFLNLVNFLIECSTWSTVMDDTRENLTDAMKRVQQIKAALIRDQIAASVAA